MVHKLSLRIKLKFVFFNGLKGSKASAEFESDFILQMIFFFVSSSQRKAGFTEMRLESMADRKDLALFSRV